MAMWNDLDKLCQCKFQNHNDPQRIFWTHVYLEIALKLFRLRPKDKKKQAEEKYLLLALQRPSWEKIREEHTVLSAPWMRRCQVIHAIESMEMIKLWNSQWIPCGSTSEKPGTTSQENNESRQWIRKCCDQLDQYHQKHGQPFIVIYRSSVPF